MIARHCYLCLWVLALMPGCALLPDVAHRPVIRNPFPQLRRVAIAPFHNLSADPTVSGREFAIAYYNELQATPGFEVVPLSAVEVEMQRLRIDLNDLSGEEARRLAQSLDVDALVVGAVTEFSPYYPPRVGMRVSWYSANPCFHPIPAGYGLPWGTPEEEYIPEQLVYEAEMELATRQLATQTPAYEPPDSPIDSFVPPPASEPQLLPPPEPTPQKTLPQRSPQNGSPQNGSPQNGSTEGRTIAYDEALPPSPLDGPPPAGWPDPGGFFPRPPQPFRPDCIPSHEPVLVHTQIYHGNDPRVTEALASYVHFRDDARFGGWQGYLRRSDDFIRFCCHLHIAEMLSARGGAGPTGVVLRWENGR